MDEAETSQVESDSVFKDSIEVNTDGVVSTGKCLTDTDISMKSATSVKELKESLEAEIEHAAYKNCESKNVEVAPENVTGTEQGVAPETDAIESQQNDEVSALNELEVTHENNAIEHQENSEGSAINEFSKSLSDLRNVLTVSTNDEAHLGQKTVKMKFWRC